MCLNSCSRFSLVPVHMLNKICYNMASPISNRLCKEKTTKLLDACTIFSLYEYIFHPMNTYLDILLKVAPPLGYLSFFLYFYSQTA